MTNHDTAPVECRAATRRRIAEQIADASQLDDQEET